MTSAGTGIIIEKTDSELLIVTNNHVVADSNQLTVTFDDQSSVEADIKGTDSAHDLAETLPSSTRDWIYTGQIQ